MATQVKSKRVCVIGAGSSGLPAMKECLHEGFQATCYEMDSFVGGIWHYKEEGKSSNTPMVWDTLINNTTKYMTAYSDFPPAPEDSMFATHHAMYKYYHNYATHFNLYPRIKFNTRVIKVRKTPDHSHTGKWEVFTCPTADFKDGDMSPGLTATPEDLAKCQKDVFDFVLICSGFFKKPVYPQIPGQERFQGTVTHSKTYRTGKIYSGRTVLIVGNSLSAVDIANDISNHARVVYLSVGEGTWIWPRLMSRGRGFDTCFPRSLIYSPNWEMEYNNFVIGEVQNKLDHFASALCPPTLPTRSPLAVGDEICIRIASNRVRVYGRLQSLGESEAIFTDGSKVTDVDDVIFCTGYEHELSFLDMDLIQENGKMDLFEMTLPVSEGPHTLGFVGFSAGDSPLARIAELQGRYMAKVFTGKLKPPPLKTMQASADYWNEYSIWRRGKYSYFLLSFVVGDNIAKLLGVYPSFWRLFFRDPVLAYRTWYGPQFTAQYRLLGPDSDWKTAKEICYRAYSEGNRPSAPHKPCYKVEREDVAAVWKLRLIKIAIAVSILAVVMYFVCRKIELQKY